MELQTIIFYGKAGSGKGTQAKLLQEFIEKKDPEHNLLYIETGAAFRDFAKQPNYTARLVKEVIESGGLLPEFLPVWVWTSFFINNIQGNEHILLDGLARHQDEVPVLYRALKFYKRTTPHIIVLEISDEAATARLKERSRSDDTDKEIARRLTWYDEHVRAAIGMWRNFSNITVTEVNSGQTMEQVHKDIIAALGFNLL